jgi:hypothetical protein
VLRSFNFFVKRAERSLEKAKNYKPRTTFWPDDIFKKYKTYKLDCIAEIAKIPSNDPAQEKILRRQAIAKRNEKIRALLNEYDAIIQSHGHDTRRNMVNADGSVELYPQAQFRAY